VSSTTDHAAVATVFSVLSDNVPLPAPVVPAPFAIGISGVEYSDSPYAVGFSGPGGGFVFPTAPSSQSAPSALADFSFDVPAESHIDFLWSRKR